MASGRTRCLRLLAQTTTSTSTDSTMTSCQAIAFRDGNRHTLRFEGMLRKVWHGLHEGKAVGRTALVHRIGALTAHETRHDRRQRSCRVFYTNKSCRQLSYLYIRLSEGSCAGKAASVQQRYRRSRVDKHMGPKCTNPNSENICMRPQVEPHLHAVNKARTASNAFSHVLRGSDFAPSGRCRVSHTGKPHQEQQFQEHASDSCVQAAWLRCLPEDFIDKACTHPLASSRKIEAFRAGSAHENARACVLTVELLLGPLNLLLIHGLILDCCLISQQSAKCCHEQRP